MWKVKLKVAKAMAEKKTVKEAEVHHMKRANLEKATGGEKRDAGDLEKEEAGRRAAVEVVLAERGGEAAAKREVEAAKKGKVEAAVKGEKAKLRKE